MNVHKGKCMNQCLFLLGVLLLSATAHSESLLFKTTVSFDGVVVSSACSVEVDNGVSRSGVIDFGLYNTTKQVSSVIKPFKVKLYENGSSVVGCSAFLAGSGLVKFTFGDRAAGQLDSRGVVTRGAGDGVRIAITSTDIGEVNSTQAITSSLSELTYPREFASRGVFGFNAQAIGLESASAGSYHGSLSLVVSYQ